MASGRQGSEQGSLRGIWPTGSKKTLNLASAGNKVDVGWLGAGSTPAPTTLPHRPLHPTHHRCDQLTPANMEHCIGLLIEPLIGLATMCAEVAGICVDGCLQTCRESCRCIACPCSACARDYDASGEEAQPILTRSQPAPTQQPTWSSVQTLRNQQHG
ncbi:hypothetical protein L1887_54459 [Cichorium endivia]|nr:hypothetical protein L1887_54459 [Cichorium endivia]